MTLPSDASKPSLVQTTIRWEQPFWEAVHAEAKRRRISMLQLVTESVSTHLSIPMPGTATEVTGENAA